MDVFVATPRALAWFNNVTPVLFVGGVALAVAFNLLPLMRVQVERSGEEVLIHTRLRMRRPHLVIAGLLLAMLAYGLVENLVAVP